MDTLKKENIELTFLAMEDYEELKSLMQTAYKSIQDPHWERNQLKRLITKFPEGQVVIKIDGEIAGCALSIIVDNNSFKKRHTYKEITGDYTFSTHDPKGEILYGVDIFIKPKFRGMRLGRRLYDYRKELCEKLNLKGIGFGGRIPNYHKYAEELTPRQYIDKVKQKEIDDPVLNFQMSNDFHPSKILKGYLEGDEDSNEYAVLLEWDNIYFEAPNENVSANKTVVRLGLIQWQMRPYKRLEDLLQQVEFFVDSVASYRSDFALFPEFFNAPLMAGNNHLSVPEALRALAEYTPEITKKFSELAITHNINIVSGSMPEIVEGKLYNVGYLCRRDG